MDSLAIYLINLDCADQRLLSAEAEINSARLKYERLSAIDGSKLLRHQEDQYDEALAYKKYGRSLSGGEIGCYLSHLNAVNLFLQTDLEYCLVLEDDIKLHSEFNSVLHELIIFLNSNRKSNFDVVNLCNKPKKIYNKLYTITANNSNFDLCKAHFFPVLTTAILWTRHGAEKFRASCQPIHSPIDQFLKDWCIKNDNGLCFLNPPVTYIDAKSQIDFISQKNKAKRGTRAVNYFIRKQLRSLRNNRTAKRSSQAFHRSLK
ncbi:glycosyltransferase family 25 protein [Amylibacter sp.]|nr:glycosyltransferase family 25 protein [Amylibacter sp.]